MCSGMWDAWQRQEARSCSAHFFSSGALTKHEKASTKCFPQTPSLYSAMQGHPSASSSRCSISCSWREGRGCERGREWANNHARMVTFGAIQQSFASCSTNAHCERTDSRSGGAVAVSFASARSGNIVKVLRWFLYGLIDTKQRVTTLKDKEIPLATPFPSLNVRKGTSFPSASPPAPKEIHSECIDDRKGGNRADFVFLCELLSFDLSVEC